MSDPEAARPLASPRSQDGAVLQPPRRRDSVRMLRHSGLPRALPKHVGPEADAYREYLGGLVERLGLPLPLPRYAVEPAREAALAFLDLRRLRVDLEGLRARTGGGVRRKEERKLRSEIRKTRVQLLLFERRLEALAGKNDRRPTSGADLLALHRATGPS